MKKTARHYQRRRRASRIPPALGRFLPPPRAAGLSGWLDSLTESVPKLAGATAALTSIGSDPAKMSYSRIAQIGLTNPDLAKQYMAIKQSQEQIKAARAGARTQPAMMTTLDGTTPAPSSGLPTWALPAALGVGAVYLLTRK